ncbi:MAG TPA: ABC transporter substrate-binding protein [Chloroflexota bacterium]|jgi:ABC-type nitrate/sulfonate/bicarbonate transport system substrate-binding protein
MRRALLSLVLLLTLACATRGGAGPAAAPTSPAPSASPALVPLRFGLNTPGPQAAPAWIAKDEGFFEKYGIDADLILLQSSAQLAPALIASEINIAVSAGAGIISSALAGSDLVLLGSYSNQLAFWFYARPEIASVADLRGKQIAVTRRGSATDLATDLVLERGGLDPNRDVIRLQLPTTPEKIAALLSGIVVATTLGTERSTAEDAGMHMLADLADYDYPLILQGIAASRGWVAQNDDVTRRTIQALAEGLAFAHQQKEATKRIMGKYTQSDDPQSLERVYNLLTPRWERSLAVPAAAIRNELALRAEEVPAARDARPEQFVDNHYADELEQSGFIQQLYRQEPGAR